MQHKLYSYNDLIKKYGEGQHIPPETMLEKEEVVYRCPLAMSCEANANCFAVAAPVPLDDNAVLNIKCRLFGGKKLPVYAREARVK